MATSPSALSTSGGTWSNVKKWLSVALGLVVVVWVCFALVLIGDHGSGSDGKITTSSHASLTTFARYWWGHGRGLDIRRSGRGREYTRTYLARPPYNATLRFQVVSVSGRAAADARIRIISVRDSHHTFSHARIRVGQLGTLRLRHGVVTDSLTHGTYCAPEVDRCGA
jgi:hypothetical protein